MIAMSRSTTAAESFSNMIAGRERICALIEQYHPFVWRTLRRLGVYGADTDDETQRVFMVLLAKAHRIQPERERAFLYGITVRVARSYKRRRAHELLKVEPTADDGDPERAAESNRLLRKLDTILDAMSLDLRAVFVLHEVEQMSLSEIAQALEIPRGTAASRLRRARSEFAKRVRLLEAERGHR